MRVKTGVNLVPKISVVTSGRSKGRYMVSVVNGIQTVNLVSFITEKEAEFFVETHDQEYYNRRFVTKTKTKQTRKDLLNWFEEESKRQREELAMKGFIMANKMSAKEGKAIAWYVKENNYGLQLSNVSIGQMKFKDKETGEIVEASLQHIVGLWEFHHKEELAAAAAEKKREAREKKWKPTTAQ